MLAALPASQVSLAVLGILTFKSEPVYVWTGVGPLLYNGNTYLGLGSLGEIGAITEGTDVQAYGTVVSLSGIDPTLLSESMTDIQLGAPATLMLALFDQAAGTVIGTPQTIFQGVVDKPTITPGTKAIKISLALETRLANLQRPSMRRYSSADQNLYYPNDIFFHWVEEQIDIAVKFGP
jgi:hypothetical protein